MVSRDADLQVWAAASGEPDEPNFGCEIGYDRRYGLGSKGWAKFTTSGLDKVHINERTVYSYQRTAIGGVRANWGLSNDANRV